MICKSCSKETSEDSKFCSKCGKEIIKKRSELGEIIFTAKQIYFILGFMNGSSKTKSKDKWFTNFEKSMKDLDKSLYEEYVEIKEYWKNFAISTSKIK